LCSVHDAVEFEKRGNAVGRLKVGGCRGDVADPDIVIAVHHELTTGLAIEAVAACLAAPSSTVIVQQSSGMGMLGDDRYLR
jgi:hypothetical protein